MMPNYESYPGGTVDGAKIWIEDAIIPGDFLLAVLENNLSEACARADQHNYILLTKIVEWWWVEAPAACWGSPEKVKNWKKLGGWHGIDKKTSEGAGPQHNESPGA